MNFNNVIEVARWRLCVGCGACSSVCPEHRIEMVDVKDDGIRPFWKESLKTLGNSCENCHICLEVCPGRKTITKGNNESCASIPQLKKRWGNVLEVWEGYAFDPEIRFKGSSGGICTALSLFCLETGKAGGVLHIGSNPEKPWKNKTYRSTTMDGLFSRTGSRYSPASPCDGFSLIEKAEGQSVFVGKPCDIAALRKTQQVNKKLLNKTALAVGFFCAGTPSTRGTLELFKKYGVEPDRIEELRYRGMGWPGMTRVHLKGNAGEPIKLSYQDSWGFLQKYRPFRCYLCPDLTAESADISVGDPWYREIGDNDSGSSLILIRTERGRRIFRQAIDQGYVKSERADYEIIYRSQRNLLGKRQAIWGRLLAMKLMGIPRPELKGFHLYENWLDLPSKEKVKSLFGTAMRMIQRKYFKPLDYSDYLVKK